MEEIKQTGKK